MPYCPAVVPTEGAVHVDTVEAPSLGLYVRLEAKTGYELEVENFLKEALPLVDDEPATLLWFAVRFGPSTFAIIDAFPDENGRQAHLSGQVASALMEKAPQLLAEEPSIEPFDIMAAKLLVLTPQQ
jgi:quinol monooxygenase YgiN